MKKIFGGIQSSLELFLRGNQVEKIDVEFRSETCDLSYTCIFLKMNCVYREKSFAGCILKSRKKRLVRCVDQPAFVFAFRIFLPFLCSCGLTTPLSG